MKFRIALISPRGPLYRHRTGIWKKSMRYAPLTLTALAALVPKDLNAEVTLYDEGVADIDQDIRPDLVGISVITGTAPRAYELAKHFREKRIPVVLGGVHPTLVPDEAADHADTIVIGFAEKSWPKLLHDFISGKMQARYLQEPNLTLENLPFARRDLLPIHRYAVRHTIEATRGCIHQCEFCVVPTAWPRPLQRPVSEVIAEIRHMGARKLAFLDLNLISDVSYAKELFIALIPLNIKWGGLTTTLIARNEKLLELAARSGCKGLLLGFESLAQDSLLEAQKGFNQKKDYHEVVRKLHELKIAIMGCFAFGFDHDTPETFSRTVEFVLESGIDLPRFAVLTPFPGTSLHHRLRSEGRILTRDWSLYDGQHIVFKPLNMSPEELQKGIEWAWKQVYRLSSIAHRLFISRAQPLLSLAANLGYRFYAYNLSRFYTCREPIL